MHKSNTEEVIFLQLNVTEKIKLNFFSINYYFFTSVFWSASQSYFCYTNNMNIKII